MKQTYPLVWPEGYPRTAIRDREARKAWKKTEQQSIKQLEDELRKFGAIDPIVLTRQDPNDFRSAEDPSISVQFTRSADEDTRWQSALRITNPAPSIDEIESAFKKLVVEHRLHPDQGGDVETFQALNRHKLNAIAYVNRRSGKAHQLIIGCDNFVEAKWNIIAVANTIRSFRQMERDGTSRIVERAMTGFAAQITAGAS